jgi:lipid-binding SYLF domain-containing protein
MKKYLCLLIALALVTAAPVALAQEEGEEESADWKSTKREAKRQKIDAMAQESLDALFAGSPKAKDLYDKAHGYAVFDNLKISIGITGGGGVGVAVDKSAGTRTYMKMGTGGLNLGLGGQKYQVIFLFQDAKTLTNFVEKGWKAEGSAQAAAGTAGANKGTSFTNGMAVYQITEGGLMLQADISGTKYWKYGKLN